MADADGKEDLLGRWYRSHLHQKRGVLGQEYIVTKVIGDCVYYKTWYLSGWKALRTSKDALLRNYTREKPGGSDTGPGVPSYGNDRAAAGHVPHFN